MKRIFLMLLLIGLHFSPLTAQEWLTDVEKAQQLASQNNKTLLLVFQGSDWCAPCIKLDKQVWGTTEFKDYAKDHFILLKADFPRKKKNELPKILYNQNAQLAEKYNKEGHFPLVVVINSNGKVVGKTGYKNISPRAYIDLLTSL